MKNTFFDSTFGRFRLIALTEGVSFLILLFLAMPLKYFVDQSDAVKYFGWCHGLLFVIYCVMLIKVWGQYNWKFSKVTGAFIASLLPFGTFILDRKLKKEMMTRTRSFF